MKKNLLRHITAFFLSVVLAVGFLLLGACLPQQSIDANVLSSAEGMIRQGAYPRMGDQSYASILDYATDSLILSESKATTITQWETIFTNPLFDYENNEDIELYEFYQYALDTDPQPTRYYVQYWMGFRPVMRLLLSFLDYYQILRYTAFGFFLLFAAVLCSLAKETGTKTAFLFALSIILVRPQVISVSLQFSCCFYIAFLAMLLVPRLHRNPQWESLFFLELGIVTMYFDFYTTPIVTFGFPMLYLYLLDVRDHRAGSARRIGFHAASWSAGYLFMWLAKLVLTSLLTEADGIGTGFSSFAGRIGIEKVASMEDYYNPIYALRTVAVSLYSDREGKLILFAAVGILLLYLLVRFVKGRHAPRELQVHWELLLLASLPILWFLAAAQPTANHHWFQYRGIAVTFWAGFLYLMFLLNRKKDSI